MTWNILLAQPSGIMNNLPQLVSTASVSPCSHWTEETLTRDMLTTTAEHLVLPVWWCSSHMAKVIPGNWTLWSTLISDAPAPQTPCRHLNIVSVKIKITLTCQLKPRLWSHLSAGHCRLSWRGSGYSHGIQATLHSQSVVRGKHTSSIRYCQHLSFTLFLSTI